jgi:ketosteroid isomerase-like protein
MSANEIEAIEATTREFYAAIDTMVNGGGLGPMEAIWDHSDTVTVQHPMKGTWSHGWEEVLATWEAAAAFGREGTGNSKLLSLEVIPHGEFAYATVIFQATERWGGETMMCTDILRKVDGAWKIIHHHSDPSPKMGEMLAKMLED